MSLFTWNTQVFPVDLTNNRKKNSVKNIEQDLFFYVMSSLLIIWRKNKFLFYIFFLSPVKNIISWFWTSYVYLESWYIFSNNPVTSDYYTTLIALCLKLIQLQLWPTFSEISIISYRETRILFRKKIIWKTIYNFC